MNHKNKKACFYPIMDHNFINLSWQMLIMFSFFFIYKSSNMIKIKAFNFAFNLIQYIKKDFTCLRIDIKFRDIRNYVLKIDFISNF